MDARFSMTARLQEAQFACFDDGEAERFSPGPEGSLGSAGLPAFAVAFPPGVRTQPAKSFARGACGGVYRRVWRGGGGVTDAAGRVFGGAVRSLECTGSGSFYFQNEALKDRFVW